MAIVGTYNCQDGMSMCYKEMLASHVWHSCAASSQRAVFFPFIFKSICLFGQNVRMLRDILQM